MSLHSPSYATPPHHALPCPVFLLVIPFCGLKPEDSNRALAPNSPACGTHRPDGAFIVSEAGCISHLILLPFFPIRNRGTMGASVRSEQHYAQALSPPLSLSLSLSLLPKERPPSSVRLPALEVRPARPSSRAV